MKTKEVFYNGTQILLAAISTEVVKRLFDDIVQNNIPIYRMKKDESLVIIPPLKLNQFLGKDNNEITFFIEKKWYENKILQKENISEDLKKELQLKGSLKKNIEKFQNMSIKERGKVLDCSIQEIKNNIKLNKPIGTVELLTLVQSVINTYCLNKATLEENMKSLLTKENLLIVIEKTKLLVEAIIKFLQQENVKYHDLNQLENVKTESPILDHMHRVMLRFIPFCIFYNEYFSDGMITNFRARFKEKYFTYYHKKIPEIDITLERVFLRGMRRITMEEMKEYALGAIFHDIGKNPETIYHSWEEGYNNLEAIKHTAFGLKLIMATKELPFTVTAMTALHHEYYSHEDGYNMSQMILPEFNKFIKNNNFDYFITYNVKDFLNYKAFAFFPCKILEIIDIFDDLYTEKLGQKNFLSISDILSFMKENFIVKKFKIDPIIFSIFIEFAKFYEGLPDPDAVREVRF